MSTSGLVEDVLRALVRPASRIAPAAVGRLAVRAFCRTPARRVSARMVALLAGGTRRVVIARGRPVVTWHWGSGPRVLLVHGWGGVGAQLATFVPALLATRCSVVTFDAPGHGASAGHESSLIHFADAIAAVGADGVDAIVAHSLGAAAATLAMARRRIDCRAAVFAGPPSHPIEWTAMFARRLGLTDAAAAEMRLEAERSLGFSWAEIDTLTLARQQNVPLLVFHDTGDDEVPFAQGEALAAAWPGARLVPVRGLGHRRILADPDVIRQSVEFIAQSLSCGGSRP